jgi:hypothetical protein
MAPLAGSMHPGSQLMIDPIGLLRSTPGGDEGRLLLVSSMRYRRIRKSVDAKGGLTNQGLRNSLMKCHFCCWKSLGFINPEVLLFRGIVISPSLLQATTNHGPDGNSRAPDIETPSPPPAFLEICRFVFELADSVTRQRHHCLSTTSYLLVVRESTSPERGPRASALAVVLSTHTTERPP